MPSCATCTLAAPAAPSQGPVPAVLSDAWLQRLDAPGPRYTSYPTADRFSDDFGALDSLRALTQRAHAAAAGAVAPLSVYVHVPFCESVCYYCACNKIVTRQHGQAGDYLAALETEMALVTQALGPRQVVSQLHLGGGTPTFLSDAELSRLMASLHRAFDLRADAEVSIEVDPRTVTPARLAHLRHLGFNRLSLGVQDFDADVQQAVHRIQPLACVRALMASARELGFASVNVDLIYGLPRQTPESFARTVAQVNALRPDRIALYAYAHLPERFKPQRRIAAADLPDAAQRVAMLGGAITGFLAQGYRHIGMDHFALPGDALAVAKEEGRLHRNFQGYSTQPDCDLIGLGVSAIGRVGSTYHQNAKTLPAYCDALSEGRLPVVRGMALSGEDVLRRDVIMALMCQGWLGFDAIGQRHGVDMRRHFERELQQLPPLAEAGLVQLSPDGVQLTAPGWYAVRAVAAVFDQHLHAHPPRAQFSRMV